MVLWMSLSQVCTLKDKLRSDKMEIDLGQQLHQCFEEMYNKDRYRLSGEFPKDKGIRAKNLPDPVTLLSIF